MPRTANPLVVGRVIGDVLEPFTSAVSMRVVYDNNKEVINSIELKPSQIVNQPRVDVGGDDLRTLYTLVMVDPDSPSPSDPHMREYLHWLVTNIPATTGTTLGQEIVGYESPRPRSGIHRLVLVLFRQPCRQTIVAPGWRQNFNTRDFAEFYNLGLPVAALYFNCQRENGSGGRRIDEDILSFSIFNPTKYLCKTTNVRVKQRILIPQSTRKRERSIRAKASKHNTH